MTVDHHELYIAHGNARTRLGGMRRWGRELAVHDWIVLSYLAALNVAVLLAPASPTRLHSLTNVSSLLAFLVATLVLVRGGVLRHPFLSPLLYRVAVYGT